MTIDSADALGKFAARRNIGITLLSDPQSTMITAFGVRDDRYGSGPYAGIAKPSIFVVDAGGKLVYSQPVDHYGDTPVDKVRAALQGS